MIWNTFGNIQSSALGGGVRRRTTPIMGVLANSGVIGLGAFLSFVIFTLWALYRRTADAYCTRQPCNSPHIKLATLATTFTAFLISEDPGGPVFWLIVGLSVAAINLPINDFGAVSRTTDVPQIPPFATLRQVQR